MKQWTSPSILRNKLLKDWQNGRILSAMAEGGSLFPLRLPLSSPVTADLSERFDEVRTWIRALIDESKSARGYGYVIEWEERQLRQLGRNSVPVAVIFETEGDALQFIGKRRDAERFRQVLEATNARLPCLSGWVARNSLTALEHADEWDSLLTVVEWFREHPRPGIYLRQVDIAGVDTKFIEERRSLCATLLDQALPAEAIAAEHPAAANFDARYGLRCRASLVRFRILDQACRIAGLSDLSVPVSDFRSLKTSVAQVFVVENETNCLAFPDVANALVIFGRGYAVELLAGCDWFNERTVLYWGDIDTHGFAMLDRFREAFPNARSLLMDRETLLAHRTLWVTEGRQHDKPLTRLAEDERDLYDGLRDHRYGERVRLEQERIAFGCVIRAIGSIT
jgi:hypothetical protein